MTSKTNEQALEAAIEKALTGSCQEERPPGGKLREPAEVYLGGNGFYPGYPDDFDPAFAIDTRRFWHFLETTQPEELEKLHRTPNYRQLILTRLDRLIKKYGLLRVLRKGLAVDDAHFTCLYQLPLASSSQSVKQRFDQNEFSVTRQVRYNPDNQNQSIDMVLFLNGLPLATIELKNPWTGQTASFHGIRQYEKRDHTQPLLTFGRCLVHFTVDTDEAYMTTRLNGGKTVFLPFNKGHDHGKGNPPNPGGHKTAYLWQDVFTRESLTNIIQHFVRFDGKAKDALSTRTLYFPRYHQLDVVREILDHARQHGVGHTYLIQHSAGSGKSNSITWTAYQLIETYPARAGIPGARDIATPLFDSVVVVTDRRLLDKQLRDNIREFSVVKNIVAHARTSKDLQDALEQGKRIIITTIQKFPFILDGIADLSDQRFAVVIDEAHSSQSGTSADKMNTALGAISEEDEEPDVQDIILDAMKARKMKSNASYMAFTATPKNATLQRFGVPQPDGAFKPFHLYSMKQAIEEGFILDVLANYTTYKSYYEIEKSIQDNPLFDTKRAQKKLRAYVERDKRTIATKAEVIMDHFLGKIVNTKKLKGKAKGMVVTQNITTAIRYYLALRQLLADKGHPFKIAIAFSGKKTVDGSPYTEADLNGFSQNDTRDQFDTDDYRLLVVANKYLTGFDQPKLCAMYVDKRLQGVMAVQALSRLNRASAKYGKKTEDLFILDFFNEIGDIKQAFDPFYTATSLSQATDVNILHDLKDTLGDVGVYEWAEVETFCDKYFHNADAQELSPIIDVAAARFDHELDLEDAEKADFKIKAKQFVKIYGQIAAILPYEVLTWEQLFWFLKFLIPKLHIQTQQDAAIDALLESVDLSTYALERTKLNVAIELDDAAAELDPQNPNPRGAHDAEEEKDTLDEIIRLFNERWFEGWGGTPEENRITLITLAQKIRQRPDYQVKVADNPDAQNSGLAFKKIADAIIAEQRRQKLDFYRRYTQDEAFQQSLIAILKNIAAGGVSLSS